MFGKIIEHNQHIRILLVHEVLAKARCNVWTEVLLTNRIRGR